MKALIVEDIKGLSKRSAEKLKALGVDSFIFDSTSPGIIEENYDFLFHFAFQVNPNWELCRELSKSKKSFKKKLRVLCSENVRERSESEIPGEWHIEHYLSDFEKKYIPEKREEDREKYVEAQFLLNRCAEFENHFSTIEMKDLGNAVCKYYAEQMQSDKVYFVDYDLWQSFVAEENIAYIDKRRKVQLDLKCNLNLQDKSNEKELREILLAIDEKKEIQEIQSYKISRLSSAGGSPVAFLMLKPNSKAVQIDRDFIAYFEKRIASIYLEKKLQKEVLDQSFRDDVSQLYNQRFLPIALDDCISQYKEKNEPFSVLFIDVDFFKKVNDTQGHLMGSRILAELGGMISLNIRELDYAFRYGGDEFLIILKNTSSSVAITIAERLRAQVEAHEFVYGEHRRNITISIGIATCPEHAATKEDVIELADQAMYYGKNKSRNIVYVAS